MDKRIIFASILAILSFALLIFQSNYICDLGIGTNSTIIKEGVFCFI